MTLPSCNEGPSLNPMSFTDAQGMVVLERLRYQRETGMSLIIMCLKSVRESKFSFEEHCPNMN